MAKYEVSIGEDFAIDGFEIEEIDAVDRLAAINERRGIARDQARITYGVLGLMVAAMSVTTFIGWQDGSYDELNTVWNAGAIWVGMVLGPYFKKEW